MNARSMSGITASGAGGDVFQNGDNVFTGTNTYNTNLPTSSVTPTIGTQLITKTFADATYATGGSNTNDFSTAFTRNGTTGDITLTTADTGTPLSGDSSVSGITDDEITAIGTNTGAISTLSTTVGNNATAIGNNTTAISNLSGDLDPCFKSATINGQDLTLTPVSGTATVLGIGDAKLDGGTSAAPQTFTEFNKFDKELILGDDLTMTSTTATINFTIDADANDSTTINQDSGFNSLNQKVKAGGTNRNVIEQDFVSNRTTGSINDFIQDRSENNRIIQDGITNSITQQNGDCVITQLGVNSTITTAGKMICATVPTGTDTTMLVNKTYVDGVASGSGSFRAFSVGDRRNPASTRSVTGVTKFDPNVVVYQFPTTITMWDFAQNHHSITLAGYYSFYWGAALFTNNAASTRLTIYKNGITQNVTGGSAIASCGNQVTAVCHCDVGDKIQAGCEVQNMCYYAFVDTTYPSQRYNTFDGYLIQAT